MNRNRKHEDEDDRRERKILLAQQKWEENIDRAKSMRILSSYLQRNHAHAQFANGELIITQTKKAKSK